MNGEDLLLIVLMALALLFIAAAILWPAFSR